MARPAETQISKRSKKDSKKILKNSRLAGMQGEPAFDGAMAEGTAASATDSGFFKSKFRDYVHSTLAEASGRYRGWSLGLASALSFPFRKCEVEPDAEPPLTEGVAQGNAQAGSTCCEIAAAAGAERVSGSAAPEVERERQDETPAEGCAIELEALVGIEDKLLSLRGRSCLDSLRSRFLRRAMSASENMTPAFRAQGRRHGRDLDGRGEDETPPILARSRVLTRVPARSLSPSRSAWQGVVPKP